MRKWLQDKRLSLGLTQEEVALKSNIARTTYAMIEQNKRDPSVKVAKKIGKILKVKWTNFFEEKCHESCKKSA